MVNFGLDKWQEECTYLLTNNHIETSLDDIPLFTKNLPYFGKLGAIKLLKS